MSIKIFYFAETSCLGGRIMEMEEIFSHGTPPVIVKVGTRDEEGASSGRDYDWI